MTAKWKRKEAALRMRMHMRLSPTLRHDVVNAVRKAFEENGVAMGKEVHAHITVALDDELNDEQAHVIT